MVLAARFGLVDYAKILAIVLFLTSAWFLLIYPAIENAILENYLIAYGIFLLAYTAAVWYLMRNLDNMQSLVRKANFFIMLFIVLYIWDLWLFPYLVTTEGVLPNLSSGAKMSSDIFLHDLLPSAIPEILRYWATYSLIPSILLTIVAILSGTRKTFVNMTGRGI